MEGRLLVAPAFGVLLSCHRGEPGLISGLPPPGGATAASADTGDTADTPAEECNGVDDDGDGEVDEGFPDSDTDGVADCIDATCLVELRSEESIAAKPVCPASVTTVADPWDVQIMWEYTTDYGCRPGTVLDLDGDGVSDILCSSDERVIAVSGRDGAVLWDRDAFYRTPVVGADIDLDGSSEVVHFGEDGAVLARYPDGSVMWEGTVAIAPHSSRTDDYGSAIEIADLWGDGRPEIIGHHAIVSGLDGSLVALLDTRDDDYGWVEREIAVVDLDGDGTQDVLSQWQRIDADGTLVWDLGWPDEWRYATGIAVANLDGDDNGEVVWASDLEIQAVDTDGAIIWTLNPAGEYSVSLPCSGDLDGDGDQDMVVTGAVTMRAMSADGTVMWERPTDDGSLGYVGCTVFDFDLDGAHEVVTSERLSFFILDGRTGAVLYVDDTWGSATAGDLAMIVDLDGDGSVEVVLANPWTSGFGGPSLRVYGHADRAWPPGMRIWGSPRWSGTQLNSDLTVPRTPHRPWIEHGIWRGQPATPVTGADLTLEVVDSCLTSCEAGGEARLAVRLVNLGPDEVQAGEPLAVYVVGSDGSRTLHSVLGFDTWLDDGHASATGEVVLTSEQAQAGVVLRAGDDGTGGRHAGDCDTSNDEIAWAATDCP